ncbi:MAG: hypothetical protein ABL949_14005 [Fimbriimonadaceae bacterium]
MAHKSPFTEEIYQEWDQLVLEKGHRLTYAEKRQRWQILYEQTYKDERWIVGCYDVGLVASLGLSLALEGKEYVFARDLCRSVLALPCDEEVQRVHFLVREGTAGILAGDVEQSVESWQLLLCNNPTNRTLRVQMLGDLIGILEETISAELPSTAMCEVTSLILAEFPGNKKRSKQALTAHANSELIGLIMDCFGSWQQQKQRRDDVPQ